MALAGGFRVWLRRARLRLGSEFQSCYYIEVLFFVYRFEAEGGGRKAEGSI